MHNNVICYNCFLYILNFLISLSQQHKRPLFNQIEVMIASVLSTYIREYDHVINGHKKRYISAFFALINSITGYHENSVEQALNHVYSTIYT